MIICANSTALTVPCVTNDSLVSYCSEVLSAISYIARVYICMENSSVSMLQLSSNSIRLHLTCLIHIKLWIYTQVFRCASMVDESNVSYIVLRGYSGPHETRILCAISLNVIGVVNDIVVKQRPRFTFY